MRAITRAWVLLAVMAATACTTSFKYDDDGSIDDTAADTVHDTNVTELPSDVVTDVAPDPTDTMPTDSMPPDSMDDLDGDGFTVEDGDCDDENPLVNPAAWDFRANGVDEDCDGIADNGITDCDCLPEAPMEAALGLCERRFIVSAETHAYTEAAEAGRGVLGRYGSPDNALAPREGCAYALLDTGLIEPGMDGTCEDRQPGRDFYSPDGVTGACPGTEPEPEPGGAGGTLICDTQQLRLELMAPSNVRGFSFDFIFITSEFPEWVDTPFADTFYAILASASDEIEVQIVKDESGAEINVNSMFIEAPPATDLGGTGYDQVLTEGGVTSPCGSSTGWLRTSWPIEPGEHFFLTFSIHDEGDGIFDSLVILDGFRWLPETPEGSTRKI